MKRKKNVIKIKRHPFGKYYLAINYLGFFSLRDLDEVESATRYCPFRAKIGLGS